MLIDTQEPSQREPDGARLTTTRARGDDMNTYYVWGKYEARDQLIRQGEATQKAREVAMKHGHPSLGETESWAVEVQAENDATVDLATRYDAHVYGWC